MYTTTSELTAIRTELDEITQRLTTVIAAVDAALNADGSPFEADGVATGPSPLRAVPTL